MFIPLATTFYADIYHDWGQSIFISRVAIGPWKEQDSAFTSSGGHLLRIEQKDQCHKLEFNGVLLLTRNGFQSYNRNIRIIKCRFFLNACVISRHLPVVRQPALLSILTPWGQNRNTDEIHYECTRNWEKCVFLIDIRNKVQDFLVYI